MVQLLETNPDDVTLVAKIDLVAYAGQWAMLHMHCGPEQQKSGSEGDLFFLLAQDFAREWIHVVNLLAYNAGHWLVSVVV